MATNDPKDAKDAAKETTDAGEPKGAEKQGGAQASQRDDNAAAGARTRGLTDDTGGAKRGGGRGRSGARGDEDDDLNDDTALNAGDNLDVGRPPTLEEIEKAHKQGAKSPARLAQEAQDAAQRQGMAGIGAEFQPREGEKPAFIHRGQYVNPDGKKATKKNMLLENDDED